MRVDLLNRRLVLLIAAGAMAAPLLVAPAAKAFRPSTRWIVDQAVKYRLAQGINALEVKAEVDRFDIEGQPPQNGQGRVLLLQPNSFRMETPRDGDVDVKIVTRSKTATKVGASVNKQKTRRDVLVNFMTIGSSIDRRSATDRLMAALKTMGVDSDVVSYSRFDGRVAYVIGSKSFETDKPQVWFDKDTLQLLRVVSFATGADGKKHRVDVQLTGYDSPEAGNWWPKRMTIFKDGELSQKWVTRRAEKRKTVEEGAFTIQ